MLRRVIGNAHGIVQKLPQRPLGLLAPVSTNETAQAAVFSTDSAVSTAGDAPQNAPLQSLNCAGTEGRAPAAYGGRTNAQAPMALDQGAEGRGLTQPVIDRLRGGTPDQVAEDCYSASLRNNPGIAFRSYRRFGALTGVHPGRSLPVSFPIGYRRFLTELSGENRSHIDARLGQLLTQLASSGQADVADRIRQVGDLIGSVPLRLKHFAEMEYPLLHDGVTSYRRIATDASKVSELVPGAAPPEGAQSMDVTFFNLIDYSYFSVEPEGCAAAGKQRSRFGKHCYSIDADENRHQLQQISLFSRDFATMPELLEQLFQRNSGSTGSAMLDARFQSQSRDCPPVVLTPDESSAVGLAAFYASEDMNKQSAFSDASSVYRFAADVDEARKALALDVQHCLAAVLTACQQRMRQLEQRGFVNSPTYRVLDATVGRILDHLDALPHPAALNALINHFGLRPQVIVPGDFVVAPETAAPG